MPNIKPKRFCGCVSNCRYFFSLIAVGFSQRTVIKISVGFSQKTLLAKAVFFCHYNPSAKADGNKWLSKELKRQFVMHLVLSFSARTCFEMPQYKPRWYSAFGPGIPFRGREGRAPVPKTPMHYLNRLLTKRTLPPLPIYSYSPHNCLQIISNGLRQYRSIAYKFACNGKSGPYRSFRGRASGQNPC